METYAAVPLVMKRIVCAEAVALPNGDRTIQFGLTGTMLLTSTLPDIVNTFNDSHSGNRCTVDAYNSANPVQVLRVAGRAKLTRIRVMITNGVAVGYDGGVVLNSGKVSFANCMLSDSEALNDYFLRRRRHS